MVGKHVHIVRRQTGLDTRGSIGVAEAVRRGYVRREGEKGKKGDC
jgi:hypothetical protein